ncbi:hypothetical protein K3X88_000585 [Campylobacter coli]|uniref:hypothetical protein n=1 Tax=Campylobacter coli TaxID=195 RepID=UPI00178CD7A0|nr:hypothetical protein [Campylobacter coli]EHR2907784.1 hypothetical protein [Campylobacter coli]EHX4704578.1 hypothetical protein [Campylobacter coli]EKZ8829613.1 hypothetical protein [Campylobacter coli]ELJ5547885.1 hypothetical protein [Campylobacter coli]ELQ4053780.1 hypothetical protein [Campylobacter coli]
MKNTVFVFEDNIIFEINIFEKSNKEDFRYFLDENSNLTKSTKNDYCGSKTKNFFKDYMLMELYLMNVSYII